MSSVVHLRLPGVLALVAGLLLGAPARADEHAELLRTLAERLPALAGASAAVSPVGGIYEIRYPGGVAYASADGRYVFGGPLLDLDTRENLTETVLREQRVETLAEMPDSAMIVFEAKGPTLHTITTFTDIDCGYCRKMHSEMEELNAAGVRVRYMMFPRAGVGSDSHRKAVAVWCAADRHDAITRAKAGEDPGDATCANPVDAHMAMARRLGLRGTPFTITDEGEPINGYLPVPDMALRLTELQR